MTTDNRYDVLISGAGPVGLLFTYLMASYGHSFYICDKKSGPTLESRGLGISSRSMALLQNRKVSHTIMKNAMILQGVQAHILGSKVGSLDACGDSSFPHVTINRQSNTEAAFANLIGLEKIAWETELVEYTQHTDGIEAVVKDVNTGETKIVHAQYIIGADGSHSVVRKLRDDWTYNGSSISTKFAICDAVVTGKDLPILGHARANFFINTKGLCAIIPLGEQDGKYYHRVFSNRCPYEIESDTGESRSSHGFQQEEPTSLSEMQELMAIRLHPYDLVATDPKWMSVFRINERKANGFRRNRAFIMGDAAHCHSPAGAQGLNLGLQDADNLAWKLSLVLNNLSSDPEALLDSYSAEREPIAALTIKNTSAATRYVLSRTNMLSAYIAKQYLSWILSFDRYKDQMMNGIMQNHIQIPRDSILLSQSINSDNLIEPGQFIRETALLRKRIITDQIERKTLHQILMGGNTKYAVMWLGTRPSCYDPCMLTSSFWAKFKESNFPTQAARPIVIESTWHGDNNRAPKYAIDDPEVDGAFWWEDRWDAPDATSKRVGLSEHMWDKPESPAAMVIVRPDLYVAYSGLIRSTDDIDTALKFLSSYICSKQME